MKPSGSRTNAACFLSGGLIYVRMLLAGKIYSHILAAIFVCRDIQARLIRLEYGSIRLRMSGNGLPVQRLDLGSGRVDLNKAGPAAQGEGFTAEPGQRVIDE